MVFYSVISIILFLFFIVLIYTLYKDYRRFDNKILRIAFCFFLAICFKYDFGYHFCGLEYEDSYAFSFLGRLFANNIYTSSFLSEGIGIGSIEEPVMMQTYGGHFITYSVFLSYPIKLFGFSFTVISIITTVINFLELLILSVFPRTKSKWGWIMAPALFCAAPIINLFGNTFLAEPFSSLLVLSFVYIYYNYRLNRKYCIIPIVAFFMAIITKRENVVLLLLPLIDLVNYSIRQKRISLHSLQSFSLYLFSFVIYLAFIQNIFSIERVESSDINTSTFSLDFFQTQIPVYIKALIDPQFFSIILLGFLIVVCTNIYKNRKINFPLIITLLWFSFLSLYSLHYRGYFFVRDNDIAVFDTFRYLNNFFCLIPIVISFSLTSLKSSKSAYALIPLLFFSAYSTMNLRKNFNWEENESRFNSAHTILDFVNSDKTKNNIIIIYQDVLVLQNLADDNILTCDIVNLPLLNLSKSDFVYYLITDPSEIIYLKERYELDIDLEDWRKLKSLNNGKSIYKLNS